jgi:hypothetical protein
MLDKTINGVHDYFTRQPLSLWTMYIIIANALIELFGLCINKYSSTCYYSGGEMMVCICTTCFAPGYYISVALQN